MLQSGPVISRRKISGGDAEIPELAVGAGSVKTRAPLNDVPRNRDSASPLSPREVHLDARPRRPVESGGFGDRAGRTRPADEV
ncbi:MAG: hypothetical protein Ct9H300mP1_08980 [Planctomycetaceae bacterium]|nr:MAG: hypothetical protein Ct9H300mP1_08980 [Planctomycetaceae bacterium]